MYNVYSQEEAFKRYVDEVVKNTREEDRIAAEENLKKVRIAAEENVRISTIKAIIESFKDLGRGYDETISYIAKKLSLNETKLNLELKQYWN